VVINSYSIARHIDSTNIFYFETGLDVISSASTDKIDFIVSSASEKDNRVWISSGFQHQFKGSNSAVGIKPSFSIESDYLSWGLGVWWTGKNEENTSRYTLAFKGYIDDLRWGRLNKKFKRPVTVIYPKELRYKEWFDIYMRYSYNLSFDWQKDINRRMTIGLFPGLVVQHGLLSTPFHRVFFPDSIRAVVENLPRNRIKIPVGVQLNSFLGSRIIAKVYYRIYWDDFDILAHTFSLELPIEVIPQLTIIPFSRVYTQEGSGYFSPYKENDPNSEFYTSDYDLSTFQSYKFGLGVTYSPLPRTSLRKWSVRYARYNRSDGLHFNQITSKFSFSDTKKK